MVEGSLLVNGDPPSPERTYRMAGAHSIVTTLGRVLATFVKAHDPETGQDIGPTAVPTDRTDPRYGPMCDNGCWTATWSPTSGA